MKRLIAIVVLGLVFFLPSVCTAEQATPVQNSVSAHRDWHVFANIAYTSRTLGGSIDSRNAIVGHTAGSMIATADSMNLDNSNALMYTLAAQYKRWGLSLNYTPTSFSGQGHAIVGLSDSLKGTLVQTSLNTNIGIDLLLGKFTYDILQTKTARFGVGVGIGGSYIDLSIIPRVGSPIIYNGNEPFGFLSVYMQNSYDRFLYGFNLNGISGTFSGVQVDYSDYTVDVGYRLSDGELKCDIIGGYRLVNFSIDIESGEEMIKAVTQLQGPFIGFSLSY
jgi:hypothetical protein